MRSFSRPFFASLALAWAGQAAGLEPGVGSVTSGGGTASSGTAVLQTVVGQAIADVAGTVAGGTTLRVQSGLWAQFAATLNSPPVGSLDTVDRALGSRVVKVLSRTLLSNDSDLDGDPLTIVSVGAALPAGSTVVVSGAFVVYTAPAGNAGPGSFEYVLSDGTDGPTATVTVVVTESGAGGVDQPPNAVVLESVGGDFVFTAIGVPGRRYRVQYTTDVQAPYLWREFNPAAIYTAPGGLAAGVFRHVDVQPADSIRLYRAIVHR
jgi:Bacterial Ig domain